MKTAIYLRVSTDRQTQAQTIEQQLERLRKHLELQSEALSADNIFRDDGYSGANLNRPGFPLSSWMFWCGRTCASSSPNQTTSLTLYSELATDGG